MTIKTSVHSNAMNFMSFISGGVDPRTGQYTVAIELSELGGNDGQGPAFKPSLFFSPLNTEDSGYGMGWNLKVSQFTPHDQVLSLSTGESFKITDQGTRPMTLQEQRLDNFHVYQEGADGLRVVHRSGVVEILTEQGSADRQVYLTKTLLSPQGHRLNFDYVLFASTHPVLATIKDGSDRLLFSLKRDGGGIELDEHPYQGEDGGPLARYRMVLQGSDNRVATIVLPTAEMASWRYTYRTVFGHLCMSEVGTPTGSREYLSYDDGGHQFPNRSGRTPLPRVTTHRIEPRFGQPPISIEYTFPDGNNFIGGSTSIGWDDSGRDNLYQLLGEYEYGSNEVISVDGQELRRIERRFDRFHLTTRETSIEQGHINTQFTRYDVDYHKPFAQQPPSFQLPVTEERQWRLADGSRPHRSEMVTSRYDTHGNLLSRTEATGVTQTSEWYQVIRDDDGNPIDEDGHPADPEGFVRHLKAQVTFPAQGEGVAPILSQQYRYVTLPALASSDLPRWHALRTETLLDLSQGEQELRRIEHHHTDAPTDPAQHGRPYRKVQVSNALQTVTEWRYRTVAGTAPSQTVLQVETLVTGYDGPQRTTLEQRSLFTGEQVLGRDGDGVETRYQHDALRRLVRETVAEDTPHQASRHYQYALCAEDNQQASQQVSDARQVCTRSLLDGLGRVIREQRDHVYPERPEVFVDTLNAAYDEQGRPIREDRYDYLADGQRLTLTQRFLYDHWGERRCTVAPDGVEWHEQTDPLGNASHSGKIIQRWRQQADLVSAREQTWLNLFENPVKALRLNSDGTQQAEQSWYYDGLGRCLRKLDERRNAEHYTYDAWGRMLSTRLPDNTLVSRDYAGHSETDLPIRVFVQPGNEFHRSAEVGAQFFDGLDRLKANSSGPRLEHYHYQGGESRARHKVVADGREVVYDYTLSHTLYPLLSSASDDEARFVYDPVSAQVTACSNGNSEYQYEYNINDQLTAEHLQQPSGLAWTRRHDHSLLGLPLTTTQDNGLVSAFQYDQFGRVSTLRQGHLEIQYAYDLLGRPQRVTSRDLHSGKSLETEIEYDDQDRECRRTWRQPGKPERSLQQTWGQDGLLAQRHLQQAQVDLLKETFSYNPRGQLVRHQCQGLQLPHDALGRPISSQTFTYDGYDNIVESTSTFAGGSGRERAQYRYAADDPCQLRGITYTPARATPNPTFRYDRNGNLTQDERGRQLTYDSQNRLLSSEDNGRIERYRYDGHNQLLGTSGTGQDDTLLLYQGNRLSLAVRGATQTHYLNLGDQPLGQQQADAPEQTLLLHTAASHSVIAESQADQQRSIAYSAYGQPHSVDSAQAHAGFNGEVLDPASGCYLLGNGYRAYSPVLMRFYSPDSLSPFGAGGLNYYGYCQGNPITFQDPTGHVSSRPRRPDEDITYDSEREQPKQKHGWLKWLFVGIAIVATIATVVTAGKAVIAAAAAWKVVGAFAAGKLIATAAVHVAATAATVVATGYQLDNAISGNEKSGEMATWFGLAATALAFAPAVVKSVGSLVSSVRSFRSGSYSLRGTPVQGKNIDGTNRFIRSARVTDYETDLRRHSLLPRPPQRAHSLISFDSDLFTPRGGSMSWITTL
ncbi:RHS repeat-associated core domain-containing protein [Pseudomonas sp. SWRI77]|uniref:RHS repeat domain-containing protein n=1 Tax=Pseudomonas sp. SWRI77 TaxID=2745485 RepID=UPI0016451061|nr:RHS repeat-associated core domain-containing protein [Pseudomonas sp. SWRI77]MBC3479727.1 RHS repeat-associated core domain-containing protein [Pseudomonas sp. SWRI77]